MASSGTQVRDVQIEAECPCAPERGAEHECLWEGVIDALIDPEDGVNGMDARWTCPCCGCDHTKPEGTW